MTIKKKLTIFLLVIGILSLILGFYYSAIKAGIPYQDPTPELLQEYNKNMKIGDTLMLCGGLITLLDIIFIVINGICKKIFNKKND